MWKMIIWMRISFDARRQHFELLFGTIWRSSAFRNEMILIFLYFINFPMHFISGRGLRIIWSLIVIVYRIMSLMEEQNVMFTNHNKIRQIYTQLYQPIISRLSRTKLLSNHLEALQSFTFRLSTLESRFNWHRIYRCSYRSRNILCREWSGSNWSAVVDGDAMLDTDTEWAGESNVWIHWNYEVEESPL